MPVVNDVIVKVDPKISIGFGTVAGLLAAVAQYIGAVGLMLAGDLTAESISAMTTATLTLITVLAGRFKQADSTIKAIGAERATSPALFAPIDAGRADVGAVAQVGTTEPETNVLYLDGKEIANAVVKQLNTQAMLNAMREQAAAAKKPEAARSVANEEGES